MTAAPYEDEPPFPGDERDAKAEGAGDAERLAAAHERCRAAERAVREATRALLALEEDCLAASAEYARLEALAMPARDYLVQRFGAPVRMGRALSARKLDPYHDPAEVQAAVDQLVDEGFFRRVGRGYITGGAR
jgi:hypothetical protein